MFFRMSFQYRLYLSPSALTQKLRENLEIRLREAIEGKCYANYGYILLLLELRSIGQGKVTPDSGQVVFPVQFSALVFRPIPNEVTDGQVALIINAGVYINVGPMRVFVSQALLPQGYEFDPYTMTFTSASGERPIQEGTSMRVRIMNVDFREGQWYAVGTANQDALGVF
ncbi:hypothetical protein RCL1_004632 [Eukaryota sp. TZLM3-RCL]